MHVRGVGHTPQFPLAGPVEIVEPRQASARLRVRWRLSVGTWAYDTTLRLRLVDDRWNVVWDPSVLHPQLHEGQVPHVEWTTPRRGPILSADGEPLFEPGRVVTVNVQPRRVHDLDDVLAVLDTTLLIDPGPLRERVEAADPDHLVEVITLRIADYAPLRATLRPVPGLVFQIGERLLTPNRGFARALLGTVGPPTAEVLDEAGPGFSASDELGLSGLQRQFQDRLAGRPGLRVIAGDAQSDQRTVLHDITPVSGEALRTTLDPQVQLAADAALAGADTTAAVVALRASTGEVLAVANGPDDGGPDRALAGRFPPGSAFTVVTAAVADGTWHPPVLLPDHADPGAGARPLDDTTASALRTLMREVVTSGTGAALRGVPGGPVHAKTGTAQPAQQPAQRTHAWVIAYQGDIAIAVFLEDGGAGGRDAAPVAARFFRHL